VVRSDQAVRLHHLTGQRSEACCAPEGPLIHAGSVAEVVSHGTASAAVHDSVTAAIKESDWFFRTMQAQVAGLSVEVEVEPEHEVEVEAEAVKLEKLEDMSIEHVFVLDFDGINVTCSAELTADLTLRCEALAKFGKWTIEIVKRTADAAGFQLLPRRWVVERTLAWLNRNRRLAKDFEASTGRDRRR
jgi:hypothetical protein